jgi:DNA-directed RNA polymerase specialized sigma24 family protein/type VI protein secretion system component VasF
MHPYADERLILQTGQGDIAALQRLFEQVYDAVYCYALSIVCDDWTAKNITEKTFLAVWEHAGDYHVETNDALPWILNLCHWQARTVESVKASERKNPYSKEADCPFMNQLLHGLPLRMRQVVILKAVMGLELHEIARIVGGSFSGTGYRYTHGMIRLERDTSVMKTLSSMEEELRMEAARGIPEMTSSFLNQCEMIPQKSNRSGMIRKASRYQPLRLVVAALLVMALVGTTGVYHMVNRQNSEITVTTENNMSLSVNGMDRVKSVVADKENKRAGANADGSTLTEVMTSVTKEELDDEHLTSDSNSMLLTVQEDDDKRSEQLQKQAIQTILDTADKKGVSPAVIIQTLSENTDAEDGKSALVRELKEVLQDCSDQGIEELSIQDLAYLYYRRGLDLESVSLHGVPSEEKYQKGREAADKIFEKLNSDETWVDIFLTVWNNQLVYQVTVLQDGVKNIYEVNAESGDIVCVVIDNEEAAAETPEAVESPAPQGQNTQTDSSSGGSYSNEIDFSDIDTWLNQGKKVVKSATSSGSVSSKINNVIRDATFGRINLNLGW